MSRTQEHEPGTQPAVRPQRVIVSLLVAVVVTIATHMTDALLTPLVQWLTSAADPDECVRACVNLATR